MNKVFEVYCSIKRKTSNVTEAKRLNMDLDEYVNIKKEITKALNENVSQIEHEIVNKVSKRLSGEQITEKEKSKIIEIHSDQETGKTKITGVSTVEPKTPEEIINLLKIDTKKWKLSQYWNKEKDNKWVVSALVTKLPEKDIIENSFLEKVKNIKLPKIEPINYNKINLNKENVCGVLSLQDLHFGKENNENIDKVLDESISYLLDKGSNCYNFEKIYLVVGPDTLNMDTFNGTTTNGTPVSNSESAVNAYIKAFNSICKTIAKVKQYCNTLMVVFIPGNHDRLSSFHLLHAVSQTFEKWDNVIFNAEYQERKAFVYGKNMICFEHGDVTSKDNALIYAVEYASIWGITKYRYLYTGHYHGRKSVEILTENEKHGFVSRVLPALTSSDYWHYHNKYVGNHRTACLQIHDYDKGFIGEFSYNV